MSPEQIAVTIAVALIGATGGILVERIRRRHEREKETSTGVTALRQAQIGDEALKRKEIDEAARDIREFLRKQVYELSEAIDKVELSQVGEREKWHQMLATLSTKNLELELQHLKDVARIDQMLEEAGVIDDAMKVLRVRVVTCQEEVIVTKAHLDQCKLEYDRLRREASVIKDSWVRSEDKGEG